MTETPLNSVNKALKRAGFKSINDDYNKYFRYSHLSNIWDEDHREEKIKLLLSKGFINEFQVLNLFITINEMECLGDVCPLVTILSGLERDGTLSLSFSRHIEAVCWNPYLEFIKSIVTLGGEIDQNALLEQVFVMDKQEFDILNYLVDNYEFKSSSIAETISSLMQIKTNDLTVGGEQRNNILLVLESKGLNIDEVYRDEDDYECDEDDDYDDGSSFTEYKVFLALSFVWDPTSFKRYLEMSPSQKTIDKFPWRFLLEYNEVTEEHIHSIRAMKKIGYDLPIDEISECLEKANLLDFTKYIRELGH